MEISFDEFQSVVGAVADANHASNAGLEKDVHVALKDAARIIDFVGLAGVVVVRELPYNGHTIFQLWGVGEKGIAYTITSGGIVFP